MITEGRRKIRFKEWSTNVIMSSVHVPTIGKEELEKRRPAKRYRDEFQKDLRITGIKDTQAIVRDGRE